MASTLVGARAVSQQVDFIVILAVKLAVKLIVNHRRLSGTRPAQRAKNWQCHITQRGVLHTTFHTRPPQRPRAIRAQVQCCAQSTPCNMGRCPAWSTGPPPPAESTAAAACPHCPHLGPEGSELGMADFPSSVNAPKSYLPLHYNRINSFPT